MITIGAIALAGLAFALAAHAGLVAAAAATGARWALAYPAVVIAAASLLAWQGLVRATWLPAAVVALLAAALSAAAIAGWRRADRPRVPRPQALGWLALALLAANALYAAFPDYRVDQWNNDLVLAKLVAEGPLRPPLFEEHVYYGGIYQYLFTLPRSVWADDLFNHGSADAFSWLLLATGLAGLFARWKADGLAALPGVPLLLAWALFALPAEPTLMNAKPDPLVLLSALAVLDLSRGPGPGEGERLHAALLGFLLVAPLALKLTWLHFAAAFALGWTALALSRRRPPVPAPGPFLAGTVTGILACAPYLLTNLRFFGNPIHPVQFGPLRSTYWGEAFAAYHSSYSSAARSLAGYAATLERIPFALAWHGYWLLVPVLMAVLAAAVVRLVRARRAGAPAAPTASRHPRADALARHAAVTGVFYVLLWPFFFPPGTWAHWLYAGFGLALVLLLWLLEAALRAAPATLVLAPTTAVLLLLPSLLAGQLPRKLEFVGRFALARPERLLVDGPLEWRIAGDLLAINADRSRAGRAGSYYEATTLTLGLESSYPLASALYRLGSREYLWLVAASGSGDCPARVLRRLDVSYVVTHASWDVWPEPYRSLARAAPRVDGLERVRRVTPAALAASAAACPPSPAR